MYHKFLFRAVNGFVKHIRRAFRGSCCPLIAFGASFWESAQTRIGSVNAVQNSNIFFSPFINLSYSSHNRARRHSFFFFGFTHALVVVRYHNLTAYFDANVWVLTLLHVRQNGFFDALYHGVHTKEKKNFRSRHLLVNLFSSYYLSWFAYHQSFFCAKLGCTDC